MRQPSLVRRWLTVAVTGALLPALLAAPPARADTSPADSSLPVTVSADPLPTVQVNGVVWRQQVIGGRVYVGGEFTFARPAGAAPGVNQVARSNLLAYDLATGALVTGFNPTVNGVVRDLAVSPDQRTLYVAGGFTTVNGQARSRVAAFDVASGALSATFRPAANSTVNAIAAAGGSVFLGGAFTSVSGAARSKVAAVAAGTGAVQGLTTSIPDGAVHALTTAPDGRSVVIGGSFTSVRGSSNPGYGLARLDAATGASLALPVNAAIRNGGINSAVLDLETDGTRFYGAGYHFGSGGNVEGSFAADWATGNLTWVEDCHGDTYSVVPIGAVVYQASHKHFCGNTGGFPQTEPWSFRRATAVTTAARGTNTQDYFGYPDHRGRPAPTFLNWYPDIDSGTYTGRNQGPWTVTGTSQYVLFGGEFTRVNNVPQQGLVRFAVSSIAPDRVGPTLNGGSFPLVAGSDGAGNVRLTWRSNHDLDNQTLTYRVYRGTESSAGLRTPTPLTVTTPFWNRLPMTFADTGATSQFRVVAYDPFGNVARSNWVTPTRNDAAFASYARTVLNDAPAAYWRLGETSGTAMRDATGFFPATAGTGITRNVAGVVAGDAAATFSGVSPASAASTLVGNAPETVSVEAWFTTRTTRGGKLVGFGSRATGSSTTADRHLYMDDLGRVHFGMESSSLISITSPSALNNGAWHHVVGTYGAGTMRLYVDGTQVASRTGILYQRAHWGFWRIGGDVLSGWPSDPTSDYFAGTLDEVAVYHHVLSPTAVAAHRSAGLPPATGRATLGSAPTEADATTTEPGPTTQSAPPAPQGAVPEPRTTPPPPPG
jgi:hypothetical protein